MKTFKSVLSATFLIAGLFGFNTQADVIKADTDQQSEKYITELRSENQRTIKFELYRTVVDLLAKDTADEVSAIIMHRQSHDQRQASE